MVGVDVLSQNKLVTSSTRLSGSNSGRSQEVFPNLEPLNTILVHNLVLVAHPVSVPSPQSGRVRDTNVVTRDNLKASALQSRDNKSQRSRGIGTRENVLVHEQTPDQVLVLPGLSQTSILQEENTIVLQSLVNLSQESTKSSDTNVLSHLKTGDLVVLTVSLLRLRSVSVVATNNTD